MVREGKLESDCGHRIWSLLELRKSAAIRSSGMEFLSSHARGSIRSRVKAGRLRIGPDEGGRMTDDGGRETEGRGQMADDRGATEGNEGKEGRSGRLVTEATEAKEGGSVVTGERWPVAGGGSR